MLNRHLSDFGIYPLLGYGLGAVFFVILSFLLFFKTDYASYIYVFLAIATASELSEIKRNELLKMCFPEKEYLKLRIVENTLLILPFFIFLVVQNCWLEAFVVFIISNILALFNFRKKIHYTLSTPFYHYPFEYLVGFRKMILIVLFAYFLTFMSVWVGNFNLGLFSILVISLLVLFFYSNTESEYYTWIYSLKPKDFLWHKLKIAIVYLWLLNAPILLSLFVFFLNGILIVLIIMLLFSIYVITYILAKYSAYPDKINLPQFILYMIAVSFPPFLLGIIPFFYKQSIKRLNATLL